MLRYIIEKDAKGDIFPSPYRRTIKPLAAPWTLGTTKLWLATDEIDPHGIEASNENAADLRPWMQRAVPFAACDPVDEAEDASLNLLSHRSLPIGV